MTSATSRWKRIWSQDSWIKPFLGQYKKTLLASIGLGLLTMIFASALMFMSGFLISDAAELPELGLYSLLVPLGLVQVFGIGKPFLGYIERLTSHDWILRITSKMRLHLYDTVESNGIFWTATHRAGDALGLLASDIGHVQNLYLRTIFPTIIAWLIWVLVVVAIGAFSPLFALIMLISLGVLTLLLPLVSVLANGARQLRAKRMASKLYANAYDQIAGLADWRFAQRESECIAQIEESNAEVADENAAIANSNRRIDLAGQVLFGIIATALLVWAAVHFDSQAQAAAATGFAGRPADWIAAFILGFFPLTEAFAPLPAAAVEANAHLDSLERLNEQSETASAAVQTRPTPVKPHARIENPSIKINGVSFAYAEGPEIIRDLSLEIEPGQKIAILGPSGCGKSTLVSLIRGDLAPTQGNIALASSDGSSIATCELGDGICDYMSLVAQSTYLFNETLYWNLTLGAPSITCAEAEDALRSVGLSSLLERLPKGIDSMVDSAGTNFSGGERHRIALARVLLRDAQVVLLDEPTVSLDPLTERRLLDTIFEVLADRTIIMVTHHLVGIEHMDEVVFMEHGRVAMAGSPAKLESESPRYRKLLALDRGLQS